MTVRRWRESWVAVLGLTLVSFWLSMAVSAPYSPLPDPNNRWRP